MPQNLRHVAAKASRLDLEACYVETELARFLLRRAGFGVQAVTLLEAAQEVAQAVQSQSPAISS